MEDRTFTVWHGWGSTDTYLPLGVSLTKGRVDPNPTLFKVDVDDSRCPTQTGESIGRDDKPK